MINNFMAIKSNAENCFTPRLFLSHLTHMMTSIGTINARIGILELLFYDYESIVTIA